ncbi:hypothetical protein H6F32_13780 [Anabaena sp. FACHB-1237]|uniref:hypothetical protein n=1 Tax=Anabaena sp. FACHB-1237 TaxID=2692769 RepID=UPI00168048C7|nr:hypothetical protein [Anabaena sp. FACHB-1237]MBD2138633.1 hypothetical protein [Anabaena sp. FACHB-1237]
MKWSKKLLWIILSILTSVIIILVANGVPAVVPQPNLTTTAEIPEEILRTEIILTARSPINGQPLTATEYTQLQKQLQTSPAPGLNSAIQDQIFVLRIRKAILQLFPFLGI